VTTSSSRCLPPSPWNRSPSFPARSRAARLPSSVCSQDPKSRSRPTRPRLRGCWHYSPANINADILPLMGVPANGVTPGTFAYHFDLTLVAIPDPGSAALLMTGVGAARVLSFVHRRPRGVSRASDPHCGNAGPCVVARRAARTRLIRTVKESTPYRKFNSSKRVGFCRRPWLREQGRGSPFCSAAESQ
jgi:hypothetical protein